jgi:Fe-S cluster biosynthesis and repair protein YggX
MSKQSKLCTTVKGDPGARIKDEEVAQCRQAGWKSWGEEDWNSKEALAFHKKELPALQESFAQLLTKPTAHFLYGNQDSVHVATSKSDLTKLSRKVFWGSQGKEILKRVYKDAFPGIADTVKDTKGPY